MGKYLFKRLVAPNLSHGFWNMEIDLLDAHGIGKECYLVAENKEVEPFFKERFPETTFSFMEYDPKHCADYSVDMNVLQTYGKQYDSVLSQALLEHICFPNVALENMVRLCKVGGIIVIHTVSPGFKQHRFPVDCLRFFPDFWKEICKYLPIKLLAYAEHSSHVFITYRRLA
jgi:SAM-dependent methyltransferase